ncbi:hypothetical protein WR25_20321 [Diploscapter pachys]|uniref:Uncharacterized protein n=1 Tax=Diploscapter pachys TaxID=2018661 RepID=A0A2A2L6Q6_9BILA|nr:hypothetical protein WR25_20321 [Diploscapter pachys]
MYLVLKRHEQQEKHKAQRQSRRIAPRQRMRVQRNRGKEWSGRQSTNYENEKLKGSTKKIKRSDKDFNECDTPSVLPRGQLFESRFWAGTADEDG